MSDSPRDHTCNEPDTQHLVYEPIERQPSDPPQPSSLGRRRFLAAAAVGCGAVIAGAYRSSQTAHGFSPNTVARSDDPAERGAPTQVGSTLPPPRTWRDGQFVTHVDVANKMMAFTFDDGPSPWNTERVLAILDQFGVKATFFLIGVNVRSWPDIAKRTHEAGHELGNHSVYHSPYRASSLAAQIGPNQDIIRDATGYLPIANRTPGLTKGQIILDTCANYGLYECHTNMATYDWRSPRRSASRLYNDFVRYQHNGAFVLYHDGDRRRPTTDALPDIIRYGQGLGYTFVTATELLRNGVPAPHTTYNHYSADLAASSDVVTDANSVADPTTEVYDADSAEFVDVCNYDAKGTLEAMLDGDLTVTYADRMRIVEALADLESAESEY